MKHIKEIIKELNNLALIKEGKNNVSDTRFYKEKIKSRNLVTKNVRKLSAEYFKQIKHYEKEKIFELCEELLKTGFNEESIIAFEWAFRLKKEYEENDYNVFYTWVEKYVDNWSKCDDFCTHAFGFFLYKFPFFSKEILKWTQAKNEWVRRAAAVVHIYSNRRNKLINESFLIADSLMLAKEDLVQKGYGWMLKEVSNKKPNLVYEYVKKNKKIMPRTALRYAIEKIDESKRKSLLLR